MQHHKQHLRQRSDALRLGRFDHNEYEGEDPSYTPPPSYTPGLKSPGTPGSVLVKSPAVEAGLDDSEPSYFTSVPPQRGPLLSAHTPRPGLPTGASTPNAAAQTVNGNPIHTFPPPPPTWSNMPAKGQLAILALSRFVDFFQMAAIQTFMVHQLKSFDPTLPDSVISHQAGILQGSFTAAQIITSILWGRAADQQNVGRKLVLNIGLVGTGLTCIGVGFSKSYGQAVAWRVLGGAVNGTVGAARTMVAECVDKRWHPRAFLLLPAAFNFANMLGPST